MKLAVGMSYICAGVALSGCTVLGFATDLALHSAIDDRQNASDPSYAKNTELFFTQEGLAHDIEVVKGLVQELSQANDDVPPVSVKKKLPQSLSCKSVREGKQQCYSAEYYKDMYIKEDDHQARVTNPGND